MIEIFSIHRDSCRLTSWETCHTSDSSMSLSCSATLDQYWAGHHTNVTDQLTLDAQGGNLRHFCYTFTRLESSCKLCKCVGAVAIGIHLLIRILIQPQHAEGIKFNPYFPYRYTKGFHVIVCQVIIMWYHLYLHNTSTCMCFKILHVLVAILINLTYLWRTLCSVWLSSKLKVILLCFS